MRKSKVIGFSIPPEVYSEFESVLRGTHKTKSEFFREVLSAYFNASKGHKDNEEGIARALKTYWDIRSASPSKTIIVGLGIIAHESKVLIGARKNKDQWIENLSWVFPGGKLESLHFEEDLKTLVKKETGLDVDVKSLIASRIHPDAGFKEVQVVALYFYCEPKSKKTAKAASGLAKLKWVNPTEVFKYFTTSVTDDVTRFLMALEKGS